MCDVLPHLLASEKMTVSTLSAESQSGEDKEVCHLSVRQSSYHFMVV